MKKDRPDRGADDGECVLVEAARDGNLRAFGELVRRYENRLFHFIRERIGNREDAEDILQTSFVTAYRNLDRYRSSHRFSTWLFTIAYRRTVDAARARGRRVERAGEPATSGEDPGDRLERLEARERLWELARRVLSEKQFAVLRLRYGEDLEIGEISRVTGLSRSHVKVLLHRARKVLGEHLSRGDRVSEPGGNPGVASAACRNDADNVNPVMKNP